EASGFESPSGHSQRFFSAGDGYLKPLTGLFIWRPLLLGDHLCSAATTRRSQTLFSAATSSAS
ncbi:MAG: hypothetical protein ACKPEY_10175, partial [Planctomycetota bacterium]